MLLSEMFGVKQWVPFGVKEFKYLFRINVYDDGEEFLEYKYMSETNWRSSSLSTLYTVINRAPSGIIHLPPPLTDEQWDQLKAIWTLGGRWIAKDGTGNVFAYDSKPQKIMICCHWNNDEDGECFTVMRELSVCSLVSWYDPEPYDIAKALGVEG